MSGLQITDLVVQRSGSTIVDGVSLAIPAGEVTVLLGANGAGKTTLLEALSGVIPSYKGAVVLDGRDLTKAARYQRAQAGLAHVEQGRSIFPDLTVEENFLVCTPVAHRAGFRTLSRARQAPHGACRPTVGW